MLNTQAYRGNDDKLNYPLQRLSFIIRLLMKGEKKAFPEAENYASGGGAKAGHRVEINILAVSKGGLNERALNDKAKLLVQPDGRLIIDYLIIT
jgi:hypothetical protein